MKHRPQKMKEWQTAASPDRWRRHLGGHRVLWSSRRIQESHLIRLTFRHPRLLRPVGKSEARKTTLVKEDQIREHLNKLDMYKSMLREMYPEALRELANIIARPLVIIFARSWPSGDLPDYYKEANVTPVFKMGRKEDLGMVGQLGHPQFPRSWKASLQERTWCFWCYAPAICLCGQKS